MSTDGQGQQYLTPPPFVTHEQLGSVHRDIGGLQQAQAAMLSSYNHLRGDMLNGFEKVDKSITALVTALEAARQADAKAPPPPPPPPQIPTPIIIQALAAVGLLAIGGAIGPPVLSFLKLVSP